MCRHGVLRNIEKPSHVPGGQPLRKPRDKKAEDVESSGLCKSPKRIYGCFYIHDSGYNDILL